MATSQTTAPTIVSMTRISAICQCPGSGTLSSRLLVGEPQLLSPHLREIAHRPQPTQPKRWIRLTGDHDVDVRREPIEQIPQLSRDLRVRDHVKVVEHQYQRARDFGEIVDQRRQDLVLDGYRRTPKPPLSGVRHRRLDSRHGRCDVAPELHRLIVARVERDPRETGVRRRARPLG